MDNKLRNETAPIQSETIDPILIGRLIQAVENNTITTTTLCKGIEELKKEQSHVALTFEHMNRDLIEIRKCADGKPSREDVITIIDKRLQDYGHTEPRESSLDASFVRDKRKNGAIVKQRITISIITFVLIGAMVWVGDAVHNKILHDIRQEQEK